MPLPKYISERRKSATYFFSSPGFIACSWRNRAPIDHIADEQDCFAHRLPWLRAGDKNGGQRVFFSGVKEEGKPVLDDAASTSSCVEPAPQTSPTTRAESSTHALSWKLSSVSPIRVSVLQSVSQRFAKAYSNMSKTSVR